MKSESEMQPIKEVIVSATIDKQHNMQNFQKETITTSQYTLQVGKSGEERLNILNNLYNPYSKVFLEKAGIANSKKVLDLACGTGEMTCWLAQQTKGKVVAIDISEEQLTIAKKRAETLGITNIEFTKLSAFDLEQLKQSFDFIYCRFLLVHIQQPEKVLVAMYNCLEDGGIMACEEATATASFCYPQSPVFDKWLELWAALRKANNTDLNLGLKLPKMFREVGCSDVNVLLAQPVLNSLEEKRILALNTKETTEAAVRAKFATKEEMETLVNNLEDLAKGDNFIGYVRNSQVWGYKNGPFFKSSSEDNTLLKQSQELNIEDEELKTEGSLQNN